MQIARSRIETVWPFSTPHTALLFSWYLTFEWCALSNVLSAAASCATSSLLFYTTISTTATNEKHAGDGRWFYCNRAYRSEINVWGKHILCRTFDCIYTFFYTYYRTILYKMYFLPIFRLMIQPDRCCQDRQTRPKHNAAKGKLHSGNFNANT